MKTGDRIRQARNRAGLTQTELGNRIGVSRITIKNYEHGHTSPTVDRLSEIAAALRVPLSHLNPELSPASSAA